MARPGVRTVLALAGLVFLPLACGDDNPDRAGAAPSPSVTASDSEPASTLPSDDSGLPPEISVEDAGGETITAEPFADFMVAANSSIWVSGVDPGVVAYDAASGEITKRIGFDSDVVQAMATDGRAVYAAGVGPDVLLSIDAKTGEEIARAPLDAAPLEESAVAAHDGTAWVLVNPGAPWFAVVEGGEVTGTLAVPERAMAARFGFGSLWVTLDGGEIAQMDPRNGKVVATYPVGAGARFLAVGDDAVWTLDARDGTVSRVDPESAEVSSVLVSDQAISGGDIAADLGGVWARTTFGVTRVDPATMTSTDRIGITPGSGSVAAAAGWLWLSDHDHLAVHRVPLDSFGG
jgi:virginiamycin B lyase